MQSAELPRRAAWTGLAVVLATGLVLRLWGVAQGLPYAYNADEADHFVPRAIAMFGHGLNPHYFANPPAFTYLLHFLFALAYGGASGARHAFAVDPQEVYTLARVAAGVLGVGALWLLYATGARLLGRAVGLLAAATEAVAFLPVFYSHLALNDVPTLAPLTASLLGSAGILRKGRLRDYLLAGVGLGLACASKYTAGIAIIPLAAATAARFISEPPPAGARVVRGLVLAALAALAAFLLANPYAVIDFARFHHELIHQSTVSGEAQGKLGAPKQGGLLYYLWSLSWGLGWVPALAALGGALLVWRVPAPERPPSHAARAPSEAGQPASEAARLQADAARRRTYLPLDEPSGGGAALGWLLVPAPVLFLAFMSLQGRYFGRWLLPTFPLLCLLAALFAMRAARRLASLIGARRASAADGPGAPEAGLVVLAVAALLAQGLIYSIHSGIVLSRPDTRGLTRAWMLAHVPAGAPIVAEPVSPDDWARADPGPSSARNLYRWPKYPSLLPRVSADGKLQAAPGAQVGIEDYERTLAPALIGYYERHGYCWVVSGSTQSGRAFADPKAVPEAIAYYRALARQGEVVYRASPYGRDEAPVAFNFDWSFDYYPLAYSRPGPAMTVYRLRAGRCGS